MEFSTMRLKNNKIKNRPGFRALLTMIMMAFPSVHGQSYREFFQRNFPNHPILNSDRTSDNIPTRVSLESLTWLWRNRNSSTSMPEGFAYYTPAQQNWFVLKAVFPQLEVDGRLTPSVLEERLQSAAKALTSNPVILSRVMHDCLAWTGSPFIQWIKALSHGANESGEKKRGRPGTVSFAVHNLTTPSLTKVPREPLVDHSDRPWTAPIVLTMPPNLSPQRHKRKKYLVVNQAVYQYPTYSSGRALGQSSYLADKELIIITGGMVYNPDRDNISRALMVGCGRDLDTAAWFRSCWNSNPNILLVLMADIDPCFTSYILDQSIWGLNYSIIKHFESEQTRIPSPFPGYAICAVDCKPDAKKPYDRPMQVTPMLVVDGRGIISANTLEPETSWPQEACRLILDTHGILRELLVTTNELAETVYQPIQELVGLLKQSNFQLPLFTVVAGGKEWMHLNPGNWVVTGVDPIFYDQAARSSYLSKTEGYYDAWDQKVLKYSHQETLRLSDGTEIPIRVVCAPPNGWATPNAFQFQS